jgi:RHS repeat-associated protein
MIDSGTCSSAQCPAFWRDSTGKERDAETGLDYFGARYYSGAQGRWTSPDWSAKPQPVPYAKLDDPQTLNLYSYVGNNPLARADLDGHEQHCFFGICVGSPDPPPPPPTPHPPQQQPTLQGPQPGRQPDGSYIAPTGTGSEIAKITDPVHPQKQMIGNGQCVTACSYFSGVTPNTSRWKPGAVVAGNDSIPIGTAVATFDKDGKFHSDGTMNSGIYMGPNVLRTFKLLDQWPAHAGSGTPGHPPSIRIIRYDARDRIYSNSAKYYYVIIVPR